MPPLVLLVTWALLCAEFVAVLVAIGFLAEWTARHE
jgi:hypothetical protein